MERINLIFKKKHTDLLFSIQKYEGRKKSMTYIARMANITKLTGQELINQLLDKGLLWQEADGREIYIYFTDKGKRLMELLNELVILV